MICAGRLDLKVHRGDSLREPIFIEGLDWSENSFEAEVRIFVEGEELLASFQIEDLSFDPLYQDEEGEVLGATFFNLFLETGKTEFDTVLPSCAGETIKAKWDLKMSHGLERDTLLKGNFYIEGSVTQ